MQGDIGVEDPARRPYHLDWALTLVDDKLCTVLYGISRENARVVIALLGSTRTEKRVSVGRDGASGRIPCE
jgi:hypothetical protein